MTDSAASLHAPCANVRLGRREINKIISIFALVALEGGTVF